MITARLYNNGCVSEAFLQRGVHSFDKACRFVRNIPYGRNRDKTNLLSVLLENTGTCSTKHALLKTLADELGHSGISLFTGIFFMDAANMPKVTTILNRYNIPCIPEAHCYLKYEGVVYDYTFPASSSDIFLPEIVHEQEIASTQISEYKIAYQRDFIHNWIAREKLSYTVDEIWKIREACIQALGQ